MITGDDFANSLNSIILYKKISAIENKMYQLKKDSDSMTVDIPEFCKPVEERFETIVNRQINQMIQDNTLDYFYKKALSNI